ncbi:hypothetical protein J5N97_012259 [Dioscorea zingiberensis]|uniref:Uncharacterized protein n=1 Tax=Dioscorea zingiberensis TaxID=325984 RepID=A0A9D5HHJ8_9LILI|nr:hypothetical protein J5N97_012259 [Dioscorea zingiberensis]
MTAVTSGIGEGGGMKGEDPSVKYHNPPARVTFPGAELQTSGSSPSSPLLKLQVEESAEGMSPHNMWQVYTLGGFMVLRWVWARWRERRGEGRSEEE